MPNTVANVVRPNRVSLGFLLPPHNLLVSDKISLADVVSPFFPAGTPAEPDPMSLSCSPSPHPGGGWASPGLNYNSGRNSPTGSFPFASPGGISAPWEATKMRTLGVTGYPSFSTHNQGFFQRHMRRISSSLPRFGQASQPPYGGFKDKQNHGPWSVQNLPLVGRMQRRAARMKRKTKIRLAILFFILFAVWVFYHSRKSRPASV